MADTFHWTELIILKKVIILKKTFTDMFSKYLENLFKN